ncbi:Uncharacterized protein containing caspase domain,Caspase domain [[Clostridium] sordellii]|uniref:caspase family protein n=1 Tax=Paraclostridium sordellii TaxID=1505 RepID=UPI000541ECB7|nr:caspase family protein [Paeniclostridium sordellii]CEK35245.1 Uncharacterized protein containing caspase domain,Caspase domain [[Clostridium] sordellii] [Paeniclostridium sordellii]
MTRYAILIGCEEYKHYENISYCVSDAMLIRDVLTEYCDYEFNNIEIIFSYSVNETSSRDLILQEMEKVINKLEEGDTLLFYFAGHGIVYENEGYLVLNDTNPESIKKTALSIKELKDLTKDKNINRFNIIDACHSGCDSRGDSRGNSRSEFISTIMKHQNWATLASCSQNEKSYPYREKEQGAFTYYVGEVIKEFKKDSNINIEILKHNVCEKMNKWCKENNKIQTPTLNSSISGNISLATRNDKLANKIECINNDKIVHLSNMPFSKKGIIKRTKKNNELNEKMKLYNVIAIEGVKGSGKKTFITNYYEEYKDDVLFYSCKPEDTIDDLFLELNYIFNLGEENKIVRYKEIFDILSKNKITLILNNLHKANLTSYEEFINYAVCYDRKLSIIIISDIAIDYCGNPNGIGIVQMNGFNEEELKEYLKLNRINIKDENDLGQIISKTGGIPFLVSILCFLVRRDEVDITTILNENLMDNSDNAERWINKIKEKLTLDELNLIRILSLCEIPFNKNINKFILDKTKDNNEISILSKSFYKIKKKYLITKFSKFRFYICDSIADHFKNDFEDISTKKEAHNILGKYYYKNYISEYKNSNRESEKIKWLLQSCEHFHEAENYSMSSKIIKDVRYIIKKYGLYEAYIRICVNEIRKNREYDEWIEYNLAHCYFILGKIKDAEKILKNGISKCKQVDVKLSMIRLYGEVLNEQGNPQQGLDEINKGLQLLNLNLVKSNILDQVKQTKSMLLEALNMHKDSIKICDEIIEKNEYENNRHRDYSIAISKTRKAICLRKEKQLLESENLLRESIDIFKKLEDKRGISWSLLNLGLVLAIQGKEGNELYNIIKEGIYIKRKLNESYKDYRDILNCLRLNRGVPTDLYKSIDNEIQRLENII